MDHQVRVKFSTRSTHSTQYHPRYTGGDGAQHLTQVLNVSEKTEAKVMQSLKALHPGMTIEIIHCEWLS